MKNVGQTFEFQNCAFLQVIIQNLIPQVEIDDDKMNITNNAKFMHCLPVRRNLVVSDSVIDSDNSLVIEQANNRVYSAQLILKNILNEI